jgi:hypothetical protein
MATIPDRPFGRSIGSWLLLLVGGIFVVLAAVNLWIQVEFSLFGVPASVKTIEYHYSTCGRSCVSVIAQVEVAVPGSAPFRTEVEDTFGIQNWVEATNVDLVCAKIRADHQSCVIDSLLDRWLLPLGFVGIAGSLLIWQMRRAR